MVETSFAQQLIRGPYLAMPTESEMTIRWRTDGFCRSTVFYGVHPDTLSFVITDSITKVNHLIRLDSLLPNTRYYYSVGFDSTLLAGDSSYFFKTNSPANATDAFGVWVLGDCGFSGQKQLDVRDKMVNHLAGNVPDLMLLLGDNAYQDGLDAEYQTRFFDVYDQHFLKNSPVYSCPGNHEYANSTQQINNYCDYYNIFSLPSQGECGGVPSDTVSYYSFDFNNVHFISLNSYGYENGTYRLYDTISPQINWLKQDLDSNQMEWTIVFFHHPPYSKGGHDSDLETELILIRENVLPILEQYKIDLVIYGHSHSYERTHLMKNHFGLSSTYDKAIHAVDSSYGYYNGLANACAYNKTAAKDSGIVYIQAGNASINDPVSATWPHPAMASYNKDIEGSLYLSFNDKRLDMEFVGRNGFVLDRFTLFHDAGKIDSVWADYGDTLLLNTSWVGNNVWSDGSTTKERTHIVGSDTVIVVNDTYSCISDTFFVQMNPLPEPPQLIRGPYIQNLFSNEVTIRWRTDKECLGELLIGTHVDSLNSVLIDTVASMDHIHRIGNLNPATVYYYRLVCDTISFTNDSLHWFVSDKAIIASSDTTRFWITGDAGTGIQEQMDVMNSFLNYSNQIPYHTWISLGDNAYPDGMDSSYQNNFFNVYQAGLTKCVPLFPIPGEREYNEDSLNRASNNIDYFSIFSLPESGFTSGINSNTSHYYSFDKGNVHFSMLNSYGLDSLGTSIVDSLNAQKIWLEQDLSNSSAKWKIVAIHHPPYSKGSFDSDTDTLMSAIREQLNPIFEQYNVDLVLGAHSNSYERSFFLKGHFANSSSFDSTSIVQPGNGTYDGTLNSCAYVKATENDSGTVYVVLGSSGSVGTVSPTWPHPAMVHSDSIRSGSLIIEVINNRLDVVFLTSDSIVHDRFTFFKDVNILDTLAINPGDSVLLSASWIGNFIWSQGDTSASVWVKPSIDQWYTVSDPYSCIMDSFYVDVIGVNVSILEVNPTKGDLIISPIPVRSGEELKVICKGFDRPYHLELVDLNGKLISRKRIVQENAKSIFKLKAGVYTLTARSKSEAISKRIIVQ